MKDKYDKAIAYLTKHPSRIYDAWVNQNSGDERAVAKAHCLFQCASTTGHGLYLDDAYCGCLTQIRQQPDTYCAATPALTKAIKRDARIPKDPSQIEVKHLRVFAQWQRKLDRVLGRV